MQLIAVVVAGAADISRAGKWASKKVVEMSGGGKWGWPEVLDTWWVIGWVSGW